MTLRPHHIQLITTGLLACCFGCPSVSDPTASESTSAVPIETALANAGATPVTTARAPGCAEVGLPVDNIHRSMFEQLNAYRVEQGLQPLVYSKTLEAAANTQVQDLYARSFFAHVNPDGKNPGDRALAASFCHKYVGENIAAGQLSPSAVMIAWKNSPSHNENMLTPDYVYVGMGHYIDPNGRHYWAQEFAYDVPGSVASR